MRVGDTGFEPVKSESVEVDTSKIEPLNRQIFDGPAADSAGARAIYT